MIRLFENYRLGDVVLRNRVVMAPMTRARCVDTIAGADTAEYYRQRATAGLIVTEGTPISPEAQGYAYVPGIWSSKQVAGWQTVTDAVHDVGGRIFAQLWHVGRLSHQSLQPERQRPVGAGAVPANDCMTFAFTDEGTVGFVNVAEPRPLSTEEVGRVTRDFVRGAANAREASFDGVELHGANGYLFEQFLNPSTNTRTDRYGGSIQNRARFLLETVDRVSEVNGSTRVGIRLSPFSDLFDMPAYAEAADTYLYLASELSRRDLAYVHLIDQLPGGDRIVGDDFLVPFRAEYGGTIILAGGMTRDLAGDLTERGLIDLAAFGQPFIANPDLVERMQNGWPQTTPDRDSYYGGAGAEGYLDYPRFDPATV
ncbi:alkene reductase [Tomitella biformata]|uniref:alkene reductase n=1 Tax=Tomitella biformata TaxID=630403 RepID=UPI000465476B|nr:alkene reductase [Tomitella biformata]